MKYHEIKYVSSRLRKNQTNEEKILWKFLRMRKLKGRRFLRQHPILYESIGKELFFFIPDFYCAEEKLIVELDGKVHLSQRKKDKRRDDILKSKGYKIIRIKNEEIKNIQAVLDRISRCFEN
jgi:very-short-patch-repair endonuclease